VASTGEPFQLSVVLFDGFELLDVCGPLEMFGLLTDRFSIDLVGPDAGPVKSATGPEMVADRSYGEAPAPDIVLVPGGIGTRRLVEDRRFLAWLSDWVASARYVASVCAGSGVLPAAGLLDGFRATSNKRAFEWARSRAWTWPSLLSHTCTAKRWPPHWLTVWSTTGTENPRGIRSQQRTDSCPVRPVR
jgi:putative intracellular protease/amidase